MSRSTTHIQLSKNQKTRCIPIAVFFFPQPSTDFARAGEVCQSWWSFLAELVRERGREGGREMQNGKGETWRRDGIGGWGVPTKFHVAVQPMEMFFLFHI